MTFYRIYLLPVAIFVLMPSTFLITYMISVSMHHVEPGMPYISDTGTYSPESCIFSQLLNVSALLLFICGWVRYAQVNTICGVDVSRSQVLRLNKVAFWLSTMFSVGTSLVSNFQETNIIVIHVLGAFLCFGPGLAYTWLQTTISYRTNLCTRTVAHIRLAMSVLGTVAFLVSLITTPISLILFHGKDRTKWKPTDGGFDFHVMSTVSEWLLALGFCFYILTFTREFQELSVEPPEVRCTDNACSNPKSPLIRTQSS